MKYCHPKASIICTIRDGKVQNRGKDNVCKVQLKEQSTSNLHFNGSIKVVLSSGVNTCH